MSEDLIIPVTLDDLLIDYEQRRDFSAGEKARHTLQETHYNIEIDIVHKAMADPSVVIKAYFSREKGFFYEMSRNNGER